MPGDDWKKQKPSMRTHSFTIRVTPFEWDLLLAVARRRGQNRTEFVRNAVRREALREPDEVPA